MIRLLYFILTIAIVSSCAILPSGKGNLRYVKTDKSTVVLDKSESNREIVINSEYSESEDVDPIEQNKVTETIRAQDDQIEEIELSRGTSKSDVDDSLSIAEESNEDNAGIIHQAVRAEKHANASFFLFIAGLISILIPYLGIIPFLIGVFFYTSSSNSRYITPFGEKRRESAKVLLFIDLIILFLWISLFVLLVFVL